MHDHTGDAGVFIRSMATRGHLGGLSLATLEAVRALDAVGLAVDPHRDGRRRPGRGGGGRRRRHHRRRGEPRVGRRGAGQQGRPARDRRRVRHQQGRPARGRRDAARPRADARPHRPRRVAPADRGHHRTDRRRRRRAVVRHRRPPRRTSRPPASSSRRRAARVGDELTRILAVLLHERARGRRPATASTARCAAAVADAHARPVDRGRAPLLDGSRPRRVAGHVRRSRWSHVERRDDGVAVLRLDNPKVNALSMALLRPARGGRPRPAGRPARRGGGHRRRSALRGRRRDLRVRRATRRR